MVPPASRSEESLALGVEPRERLGAGEVRKVVAALPILGDVEDHRAVDLHLTGREVALEVGRVVPRVPQAELGRAEQREACAGVALVRDPHAPHLEVRAERHEEQALGRDAVLPRLDDGVAEAVTAAVAARVPRRPPPSAGLAVSQVEVAAVAVERNVVVAVAGEPAQPRVSIERVAPSRVGDQREVALAAEVVDPRQRGVGSTDDVFTRVVVERAVSGVGHPDDREAALSRSHRRSEK